MVKNIDKYTEEISQIISYCPIPLSKIHLKKMGMEHLIPHIKVYKYSEHIKKLDRRDNIYITLDGQLVKSAYELLFANFLYLNNIEYSYNLVIPVKGTSFRYDFKVKDIYFEIFGYYGSDYIKRMNEKIELYHRNKLKLVGLQRDFFNCRYSTLYKKLINLCKEHGIKSEGFFEYKQELFLSGSKNFLGYIYSNLESYILKNNTLPNSYELRKMELGRLEPIINKFGGYKAVSEQLGLDSERFRNSWDEIKSKREFLNLCKLVKRIPTDKDYEKYGLCGLLRYLRNNKKKEEYENLARSEGYKSYNEQKGIKDPGYWNLNVVINEIKPLCVKLGRIPTKSELLELGLSDLESALQQYTSREELSEILGFPTYNSQNDIKSYTFFELNEELSPIIKQLGYLPSRKELENLGRKELYSHICKFGGPTVVAKKCETQTFSEYHGIKESGFWTNENNINMLVCNELLPLVKELGYIPNESYLRNQGMYEISLLIQKMGGRKQVSKRIGYPTYTEFKGIREDGFWENKDNLIMLINRKLKPIVNELGYIPTEKYLKEQGLRDVRKLIEKFGGRKKISDYLGYPTYRQMMLEQNPKN